jgi:arylsulfatase A-like enzyme
MPAADLEHLRDLYRAEIRWMDAVIARIIRRLGERGDLGRTLLIVVADHGEEFFEHGRHGHRFHLYEETLRVPLLIRMPGAFDGGRIVDDPVSLVDVFPTVAAVVSDDALPECQGIDLARTPIGPSVPRAVFAEHHGELEVTRTSVWKAIRVRGSETGELYFLVDDPGETRDFREREAGVWRRLEALWIEGDPARFAGRPGEAPRIDPGTKDELRALGYTN